jgi:hypothetical protein
VNWETFNAEQRTFIKAVYPDREGWPNLTMVADQLKRTDPRLAEFSLNNIASCISDCAHNMGLAPRRQDARAGDAVQRRVKEVEARHRSEIEEMRKRLDELAALVKAGAVAPQSGFKVGSDELSIEFTHTNGDRVTLSVTRGASLPDIRKYLVNWVLDLDAAYNN